jgi:ribosomal protein S11
MLQHKEKKDFKKKEFKMIKKKYKLKNKKNHFFFGNLKNKIANIYIKRSFTNIFITLCDLNNKVIICKTSGSSDSFTNKRRKRISQAVEKIILKIKKTIKLYNIVKLHIILKMKIKSHVYTLINRLKYYGLIILSICSKRKMSHNGVKGRNIRRL